MVKYFNNIALILDNGSIFGDVIFLNLYDIYNYSDSYTYEITYNNKKFKVNEVILSNHEVLIDISYSKSVTDITKQMERENKLNDIFF